MRYYYSIFILFLTLLSSCTNTKEIRIGAYFGGQIINPTDSLIYLKFKGVIIDSAKIDRSNKFSLTLDSLDDGLYEFSVGKESQLLYLENGDSLLLRLNTYAFDESAAYSGLGSGKENFLMTLFLQNEAFEPSMIGFSESSETDFLKIIKEQKVNNQQLLQKLNDKYHFSDSFLTFANHTIAFNDYDLKERYYYLLQRYRPLKLNTLPKDYLSYREHISSPNADFETTYTYQRFLNNYLKNRAISNCLKTKEDKDCNNNYRFGSIMTRINLLDSLCKSAYTRNFFYELIGKQGVILANDTLVATKTIELLSTKKMNDKEFKNLKNLAVIQRLFQPGVSVSNVAIISSDKKTSTLRDILQKPSVIYSWRLDSYNHQIKTHKKIKKLEQQYPEVDFIGVHTEYADYKRNVNSINPWLSAISKFGYNKQKEFHILASPVITNLLKNYTNKVIFVDVNGEIIIGATLLNSDNFKTSMTNFIKKLNL